MGAKHWDILEEIEYMTEYDGFVETCLDLRDNMLFYDKGLILAGYSSTVELLITLAYMWGSLSSDDEASSLFEAVEAVVDNFSRRLVVEDMPMDVRMMVDGFLETGGWIIQERMPLFRRMFTCYLTDGYNLSKNINEVLRQAQGAVDTSNEKALQLVAQVGAMALRGERIRPAWLYVLNGQMQIWIRGIMNLVNNFASAPHFSFPFDEAAKERGKWQRDSTAVTDLKAFRNRRYPLTSFDYTNDMVLETDEIDQLLMLLFTGLARLEPELVGSPRKLLPVRPLLQAIVESPALQRPDAPGEGWAPVHCVRVLKHMPTNSVIDTLVSAVVRGDKDSPVVTEAVAALSFIGDKAAKRIVKGIGSLASDDAKVVLATVLSDSSPSAEVLAALLELFQTIDAERQKIAILKALVHYGDPQAVPVLEAALRKGEAEGVTQLPHELQWAISELRSLRSASGDEEERGKEGTVRVEDGKRGLRRRSAATALEQAVRRCNGSS